MGEDPPLCSCGAPPCSTGSARAKAKAVERRHGCTLCGREIRADRGGLAETEDRTDFVRAAVERELARREKRKLGKAQSEG